MNVRMVLRVTLNAQSYDVLNQSSTAATATTTATTTNTYIRAPTLEATKALRVGRGIALPYLRPRY